MRAELERSLEELRRDHPIVKRWLAFDEDVRVLVEGEPALHDRVVAPELLEAPLELGAHARVPRAEASQLPREARLLGLAHREDDRVTRPLRGVLRLDLLGAEERVVVELRRARREPGEEAERRSDGQRERKGHAQSLTSRVAGVRHPE